MTQPVLFVTCLAVGFSACASEAAFEDELGGTPQQAEQDEPAVEEDGPAREVVASEALPEDLAGALEREALAPGYRPAVYPEPPYGFVQGSIIPNFEFLGWSAPVTVGHDLALLETIDMAGFYDPTGEKGIELLLVNAVTVWCSVCQVEYRDLEESGTYAALRERGFEMLGVLFEDGEALPARYQDLVNWTRAFGVDFPFVLDPGFKMGAFFDRSATPMNMVVDARTMKLLVSMTGYNPELFAFVDRELTARGR